MQTHRLRGPAILNPFWFNRVRHGEHVAVVGDTAVVLDGEQLHFVETQLPAGTAVKVWLNFAGHFVCASEHDLLLRKQEQEAQAQAERDALNRRRDALRAEAQAFNARLTLPVRWDVGIKDVLSGLSESSMGHGRNKSTVEHIYLLEALDAGRLQRSAGDLLCTGASGTNGKRWSNKIVERCMDGTGNSYQPKVTCRSCLALASRWIADVEQDGALATASRRPATTRTNDE